MEAFTDFPVVPRHIKLIPDPYDLYPDQDGRVSDDTEQWRWICTLKLNIDSILVDDPTAFAAADNLIYAVDGDPKKRTAPDVYVAFGRPKGRRGSYKVWKEDGIFPQVIFEVLSPGNRPAEMSRKLQFFEKFGAEEYYIYDPDSNRFEIYIRSKKGRLALVPSVNGYVSPRLGIRFESGNGPIRIFKPNGEPFLHSDEIEADRQKAHRLKMQADAKLDQEKARADEMAEKAERLAAQLRALGIDPQV